MVSVGLTVGSIDVQCNYASCDTALLHTTSPTASNKPIAAEWSPVQALLRLYLEHEMHVKEVDKLYDE